MIIHLGISHLERGIEAMGTVLVVVSDLGDSKLLVPSFSNLGVWIYLFSMSRFWDRSATKVDVGDDPRIDLWLK